MDKYHADGRTVNSFSWKIAGIAGDGILNAGMMFAKACKRAGLYVFATAEYPSLIRGGHNHLDVRVSSGPIFAHTKHVNLLVALNNESIIRHAHKIPAGGGIICDSEDTSIDASRVPEGVSVFPLPLKKLARENGGEIMRNTVAMGASFAMLDFNLDYFSEIINQNFIRKGINIVSSNILAAKAGYDHVKQNFHSTFPYALVEQSPKISEKTIYLSGNEAIVCGAIKAGCKLICAYPMTPASSIMMTMARFEKDYNVVVKQTEDEIAAINMAIGANFAGIRAMTATSGGGFALMVEGLGLAAQTETPLVVVEAMRPGPATGMATHSGQGDLRFVLHASTDEFPRVVVAPGDVAECFHSAVGAFNIAEAYQLPVIILTDKFLGESYQTVERFPNDGIKIQRGKYFDKAGASYGPQGNFFKRYLVTPDGISPRSIPGQQGGIHVASSYEHDQEGFEREDEDIRVAMHRKRFRKIALFEKQHDISPHFYGDKRGDISLVGWGSTKMSILEAMKLLNERGIRTGFMQPYFINPFPSKHVAEALKKAKKAIVIENNYTSQLGGIIREKTGIELSSRIIKYDGRPFSPEDLADAIERIVKGEAESCDFGDEYEGGIKSFA